MGRKPFVGGNWKCNGTLTTLLPLAGHFAEQFPATTEETKNIEIVIAPTSVHLLGILGTLATSSIRVGCQNINAFGNGAYTGEVSADILKDLDVHYTLIGHSERRNIFKESHQDTKLKLQKAQTAGITAIFCVGEMLNERENGETQSVIKAQLDAVADVITDWDKLVIAYEPVWAIGTGKVATAQQAQEVHEFIRMWVREKFDDEKANGLRIIYGGSVTPSNCAELLNGPDVDGFLVGGASLQKTFVDIIKTTIEKRS
jgi:triosephosphate isomerase (TIM)